MTAPGREGAGDRKPRGDTGPVFFSEEEKLLAQREARRAASASGRRTPGLAVSEYMAHERCTEACSSPGHGAHSHHDRGTGERAGGHAPHRTHLTPEDVRPRVSDLWNWLSGGGTSRLP